MTATGWTIEYIDRHMDLPTLDGMNRAWAVHPPTHVSLAQDARQQQAGGEQRQAAMDAEFDSLYTQLPTMDRRPQNG